MKYRTSRPEVFCKKGILRPATLLKKRLWHRCFPVNFAKFLRTHFVTENLRWLLLEILKIRYQFYILMKNVIILRKIHAIIKSPFFNNFSLSLNRKKTCGKESHENETKHIHASAADLLHFRIENLDWRKFQKQLRGCVL